MRSTKLELIKMNQKVTITKSDFESLDGIEAPKDYPANKNLYPSLFARVLLFPLILIFPLLCFAVVLIRLAQNNQDLKKELNWVKYCNTLLIVSGLFNILFALACYEFKYNFVNKTANNRSVFILNTDITFINPYSQDELKTKDLAKKVENNIFIISKVIKSNNPSKKQILESGFGTSFLIYANKSDCLLVTCRHVIDGEDWKSANPFNGDVELWDRKGGNAIAKIVGRHRTLDLMLLHIKRNLDLKETSFSQPIIDSNKTELGENVMIYGHPEGLFFSIADGLVSRKGEGGIIQITAPVSPGNSGGPVYNFHGQLTGIVSSMVDKSINKNSENLNFAIPADAITNINNWNLDENIKSLLLEYIKNAITEQKNNN
jgi:S1-C subfamily serine protease